MSLRDGIRKQDAALGAGPAQTPCATSGEEVEHAEWHLPPIGIVPGTAGKDRFFAAVMDNAGGVILALFSAGIVPNTEVALRAVALVAGYLGYFFVSEAAIGTSPGKLAFGLWVRRLEGGPCSIWQAAVRTLARLVEVNPLLLGAIPAGIAILASTNRQRIGDMLAGTVVRVGRSV